MPGWFSAFIACLLLLLAGLLLYYIVIRHRKARGPKLATLYVESKDLYEVGGDSKEERLGRLQNGMVMWKCAFGSDSRRLKRVELLGGSAVAVSKDIDSRSKLGHTSANEVIIELRDVLAIQLGPLSRAFRQHIDSISRKDLCFSILTADRTLDLEALTEKDCEDWFLWLQSKFKGHQRWAGLPFYTKTGLYCAFENMRAGKMPPIAFSYDGSFETELKELEDTKKRKQNKVAQSNPRATIHDSPSRTMHNNDASATFQSRPPNNTSFAEQPELRPSPPPMPVHTPPPPVHTIDIDCSVYP